MTMAPARAAGQRKARFLESITLPISKLRPNPLNPRPPYHFDEDNPHIREMSDSLKVSGQHNALKAYELLPEEPGIYMLVQGHRRWYSAIQAGEEDLEVQIITRPQSVAEELDWLGSEDSLRQDWGDYAILAYARVVAEAHGLEITSREVGAKVGLGLAKLRVADKMFRLDPAIVAHVQRWEEYRYKKDLPEKAKLAAFPSDSGIRISDFSPEKAADVYDIVTSMRSHCPEVVKKFNDFELQVRIAQVASRASREDLTKLRVMVDSMSKSTARPGALSRLVTILEQPPNERIDIRALVRQTRNAAVVRMIDAGKKAGALAEICQVLEKQPDQLGADLEQINAVFTNFTTLLLRAERFHRVLEKKREALEKGKVL